MIADIASLIARQGEIQADAAARNAAIWGQTIANIGQTFGNYPAEQLARTEAQQRQQIVQMQLDAAKRQQAATAQIATLPRQADGTFDTGAVAQTLQRNGVDAESSARTLKSLDDLNGIITKANQSHLDHLADVAQLLLSNATPASPVTVDDVHRAFAAVKPIPSFGLTDADEQRIVTQIGQGADPRQLLMAIRDQGTAYKAARAKLMEPQKLGPGDIVGIPGTGQKILENPKAPPAPTEASLAADAATLGTPNETPTAARSKAALEALQAPAMASRADAAASLTERTRHDKAMEARAAATAAGTGAAGSQLTDDGLDLAAAQYRITGKMPPMGMGKTPDRARIINRAAEQSKELGQTPAAAIQRQYAMTANAASLKRLSELSSTAEASENKAIGQIQIIKQLSAKVPRTQFPVLNSAILSGKINVLGDPDAQQLANAISTFSNEYGKIIEGSTASVSGSSDASRRASSKLIGAAMNGKTLDSVLNLMQREMDLTVSGYGVAMNHVTEKMGGPTPAASAAPAAPAATPAQSQTPSPYQLYLRSRGVVR